MEKLEPPVKRHLSGKRPTHSSTENLHSNFRALDKNALLFVFSKAEYLTMEFKPTKKAVTDGLIDSCEKKVLWNLNNVQQKLGELGMIVDRQSVNQDLKDEDDDGEPRWVNLGTIATYFNTTAKTLGKWLDELGYKDDDGMGSQLAMDRGLATVSEMNAGGKKTRKITMWNLYPTQRVLLEAGHELDFDYGKSLKGTGKSSDVSVTTVDDRAKEFAKNFATMFKNKEQRKGCEKLVKGQPKIVIEKAEKLLNKPGFISSGKYLKYIK